MPTKAPSSERVSVTGIGWKKSMGISAQKYEQVSKAILAVLSVEPIKFSELARQVGAKLPNFEGSVRWYTISVARELEVQGKLVRHAKPVLYSMPGLSVASKPASDRKSPPAGRRTRSAA
ncbi:MAG: hypothetical protein L0Z53_18570 [Acidobacteriales bacterium]|nr:hypothetical protein [Terriglobales bacterium]